MELQVVFICTAEAVCAVCEYKAKKKTKKRQKDVARGYKKLYLRLQKGQL